LKETVVEQQIKLSKLERQDSDHLSNLPTVNSPVADTRKPSNPEDRNLTVSTRVPKTEQHSKQVGEQTEKAAGEKVDKLARARAEMVAAKEAEWRAKLQAESEARRVARFTAWEEEIELAEREAKEKNLERERGAKEKSEREAKKVPSDLPPISTSSASGLFDGAGNFGPLSPKKKNSPGGVEESELCTPFADVDGVGINGLSSPSELPTPIEIADVGKLDTFEDLDANKVAPSISTSSRSENGSWTEAEQVPSPVDPIPPALAEPTAISTIVGDRQSVFTDTAHDQKREYQRQNTVEGLLVSSLARRNDSTQSHTTSKPTPRPAPSPAPAPQKSSGWGSWGSSLLGDNTWGAAKTGPTPIAQKPSTRPSWGAKPASTPSWSAKPAPTGPAWGAKPAVGSGGTGWGNGTGPTLGSGLSKKIDTTVKPLESKPNPAGPENIPEGSVEIKHVPAPGGFGSLITDQNEKTGDVLGVAWGWEEADWKGPSKVLSPVLEKEPDPTKVAEEPTEDSVADAPSTPDPDTGDVSGCCKPCCAQRRAQVPRVKPESDMNC